MATKQIPDIVIGRLPIYLRSLQRMLKEGRLVTSSQDLGERLGISAAQIRKDLSQFGEFGKQGTGYHIDFLIEQLSRILQVDKEWPIAVIGAGDIGSAVARYKGFANRGFKVEMIFDSAPEKIGAKIGPFTVRDSANMITDIQSGGIKIAMLAVPAPLAQDIVEQLVKAGIKSILNYAPISLNVPPDVHIQYIDPSIHLQTMTYYLK
ncbi:redox-sensing transcriptional repressor Rex [Chloroflexota bacterium]